MWKDVVIRETENSKPKTIGQYNARLKIFETTRDFKKHLLRKKNAWAIDKKLLEKILVPDNATIVIIDAHRTSLYKTTAEDFIRNGEEICYLDHRPQVCLNLEYFIKECY